MEEGRGEDEGSDNDDVRLTVENKHTKREEATGEASKVECPACGQANDGGFSGRISVDTKESTARGRRKKRWRSEKRNDENGCSSCCLS